MNLEEAIIRTVNDTRDNDTIVAVIGAAVGKLPEEVALSERWRARLLGRTKADDDGPLASTGQHSAKSLGPRRRKAIGG